jgi:type IV pilus assembly protein PilO
MAGLPTNQRDQLMLIGCVVALAAIYGYYEYMWKPKGVELDRVQARLEKLQASNAVAEREVLRGGATKLKEEAEAYGRVLVGMRQFIPVANEVPTLLDQISTAARQTGMDLGPVTPLPIIPGDVFDTHRFTIGVTGPYHRVAQFLNNIGSLTRIVAPMNLSLTPAGRGGRAGANERPVSASFEIQTYVAKAAPAAPAAAQAGRGR